MVLVVVRLVSQDKELLFEIDCPVTEDNMAELRIPSRFEIILVESFDGLRIHIFKRFHSVDV